LAVDEEECSTIGCTDPSHESAAHAAGSGGGGSGLKKKIWGLWGQKKPTVADAVVLALEMQAEDASPMSPPSVPPKDFVALIQPSPQLPTLPFEVLAQ